MVKRLHFAKTSLVLGLSSALLVGMLVLDSPSFGHQKAASTSAPDPNFPATLSGKLPYDVDETSDLHVIKELRNANQIAEAQRQFDITAWKAFIALNWPAGSDGEPDASKNIGDVSGPRVWNYWRAADSIFLAQGKTPAPWEVREEDTGGSADSPLFRAKGAWRQSSSSADENFQAFTGPLIDQNGKWVRYEVRMNHEEFQYVFDHQLYNLEGQEAFNNGPDNQDPGSNAIQFPINDGTSRHGAIEIKFAWKELGKDDDPSRFYTVKAWVLPSNPSAKPRQVTMGMVGMHIAMRTASSPEWIWATFEQVDNCQGNELAHIHANFNNPNTPVAPVNILAPKNARIDPAMGLVPESDPTKATTWIENNTTSPTQVTRVIPIAKDTQELNAQVQKLLASAGGPFQYYELIGTQWPIQPNAPAAAGGAGSAYLSVERKTQGRMHPVMLTSMVMETFFQGANQMAGPGEQDDRLAPGSPPIDTTPVFATESCVGCHYSAGSCIGFQKSKGFPIVGDDGKPVVTVLQLADGVSKPVEHDDAGNLIDAEGFLLDSFGRRIPIFGENSHGGNTGSAEFSWLLQIEAKSTQDPGPKDDTASGKQANKAALFLKTPSTSGVKSSTDY